MFSFFFNLHCLQQGSFYEQWTCALSNTLSYCEFFNATHLFFIVFASAATEYFFLCLFNYFPSFKMDNEFQEIRVHTCFINTHIPSAWQDNYYFF